MYRHGALGNYGLGFRVLCTVMGDTSLNHFIVLPNMETLHSAIIGT